MKREILFRGKRIDNGEWVYGTPIYPKGYDKVIITTGELAVPNVPDFGFVQYEVIPETVGEYIKSLPNGDKAFSNSRFEIISNVKGEDGGSGKRTDTAIIRFNENKLEWELKVSHKGKYKRIARAGYFLNSHETKVIGTIFDKEEV